MDLAHRCLADCYFLFCYLSLALHLHLPWRTGKAESFCSTNQYRSLCARGYQFPASTLKNSRGRIWLVHYVHLFFFPHKSMFRQCHFNCTEINFPSSLHSWNAGKTVAVQLQVKRLPLHFLMFASLWQWQLVLLNANGGGVCRLAGPKHRETYLWIMDDLMFVRTHP